MFHKFIPGKNKVRSQEKRCPIHSLEGSTSPVNRNCTITHSSRPQRPSQKQSINRTAYLDGQIISLKCTKVLYQSEANVPLPYVSLCQRS